MHHGSAPAKTRRVDLSHTIEEGLITYRGLPAPLICDFLSREASHGHYDAGTEFQIGRIEMVGNTGTCIDAPFHRFADGKDLAALTLDSLADLECVVVRVPHDGPDHAIDARIFRNIDPRGKAVLVHTGWDRHWNTERYFEGHAFLTGAAADCLVEAGARLVGIDSLNIDDTRGGTRPVHTTLLGHDIPIVEHMTGLGALPDAGARFFAAPPMIKAMGSFPVRAFCLVPEDNGDE
ncbi:MAG: cyclase family protein [Sphingomonadales bacterium]